MCKKCGLVRLYPMPTDLELVKLYNEDYFESCCYSVIDANRKLKYIESITHGKKILDIGCGTGQFLCIAKDRGWETYGIEPSAKASEYAQKKFGLKVLTKKLEEAELPDKYFDVITMWHSLEHIPDPSGSLQAINRSLKDNGLLVISLPNISSFDAKYYGKLWRGLSIPFHLYHYSPKTLRILLEKTGFDAIGIDFSVSEVLMKFILELMPFLRKHLARNELQSRSGCTRTVVEIGISLCEKIFKKTIGRILRGRDMIFFVKKSACSDRL